MANKDTGSELRKLKAKVKRANKVTDSTITDIDGNDTGIPVVHRNQNTNNNTLTPQQLRFVEEYLKSGVGSKAALIAGYSKSSCRVRAFELLKDERIKVIIEERTNELKETNLIDRVEILKDLIEIKRRAMNNEIDIVIALKAIDTINKMCGFNAPEKLDIRKETIAINYIVPTDDDDTDI